MQYDKEPKLSVIIVNYNVKYFLEQCLGSVYKAIRTLAHDYYPFCAEIWVVDNNSPDGSVAMVKEKFPEVHVIANTDNKGFSYANNQAIRQSKSEYVLLLNPDTVVAEDTFSKILKFMDESPDAGGLGMKMVDGKGDFLPESKRGLPTPEVAFYKVTGLSKLFPKTRLFGRYHQGFLDKNKTHEIAVLAGAAMMLRRAALDKSGLLDEDFFMYGEDIDLSYRITKAGYRNYYFPGTTIIHYKGESTKKSSINYVFVFYRAMVIFAKKHFAPNHASLFAFLINIAIYLRAGAAIISRFMARLFLPFMDGVVLYVAMLALVKYWEHTIKYVHGGKYPPELTNFFIPVYIVFWVLGLFFAKGYQKPYYARKLIAGAFWGILLISVAYAFLDEEYRYSRAIIVLGSVLAVIAFSFNRLIITFIKNRGNFIFDNTSTKKTVICGTPNEAARVARLLDKAEVNYNNIGIVSPNENESGSSLGSFSGLDKIIRVYKVNEVVFCAKDIPFTQIIETMEKLNRSGVEFKIVPQGCDFIIGSHSKNKNGDYYARNEELLAIDKKDSRLNKRSLDMALCFSLLISLPLNIWFIRNPLSYISNIFKVLSGKNSWVGYSVNHNDLPVIRKGILSPSDELNTSDLDPRTKSRLDFLYAKDYSIYKDLSVIFTSFAKIGKTVD